MLKNDNCYEENSRIGEVLLYEVVWFEYSGGLIEKWHWSKGLKSLGQASHMYINGRAAQIEETPSAKALR